MGALWVQGGCLGDPVGPMGWFDESSNDSFVGISACIQGIQIFIAGGRVDGVQRSRT